MKLGGVSESTQHIRLLGCDGKRTQELSCSSFHDTENARDTRLARNICLYRTTTFTNTFNNLVFIHSDNGSQRQSPLYLFVNPRRISNDETNLSSLITLISQVCTVEPVRQGLVGIMAAFTGLC